MKKDIGGLQELKSKFKVFFEKYNCSTISEIVHTKVSQEDFSLAYNNIMKQIENSNNKTHELCNVFNSIVDKIINELEYTVTINKFDELKASLKQLENCHCQSNSEQKKKKKGVSSHGTVSREVDLVKPAECKDDIHVVKLTVQNPRCSYCNVPPKRACAGANTIRYPDDKISHKGPGRLYQ